MLAIRKASASKRQRQREADQFHGRIVPAAGRQGGLSCRDSGGIGFTHLYAISIADQKQQRPRDCRGL